MATLKSELRRIPTRVAKGIALLTKTTAKAWWHDVNERELDLASPAMCVVGQSEIPIPAAVLESLCLDDSRDADFGEKLIALMKMSKTSISEEDFGTAHGFETANLDSGNDVDAYYVALTEEWKLALSYLKAIPASVIAKG